MSSHTANIAGVDTLRIPLLTQPNRENECLLYTIGMVLQYCSSVHPSDDVKEGTVMLSPQDLKNDYIRIRESGWAPSPEDLDALSDELGIINLEMKYWSNSPPSATFDHIVKNGFERDMPTIAVVDAKRIQGLDSEDGQHATIVAGLNESHAVLADPWEGNLKKLNKRIVTDAWDTQLNRLITIEASVQDSLSQSADITKIS